MRCRTQVGERWRSHPLSVHLLSPPICPPLLHHRSPFCCFLRSLQFNPHSDSDSHKAPPTLSYLSSPPHPGLRPSAFHFPLLSFSASLRGVKGMMKIGGGGWGKELLPLGSFPVRWNISALTLATHWQTHAVRNTPSITGNSNCGFLTILNTCRNSHTAKIASFYWVEMRINGVKANFLRFPDLLVCFV